MMRSTCRAAEWAHVSCYPKKYDYTGSYSMHIFLGSPEDDDRHFLECLGVSGDASNMAGMVSRIFLKKTIIFRSNLNIA